MQTKLHFSYGAGMSQAQMDQRCPGSTFVAIGHINEYELVFDGYFPKRGGPVANIVPRSGKTVRGVLYQVPQQVFRQLGESKRGQFESVELPVLINDTNEPLKAAVFLRKAQPVGIPPADYLDLLLKGARERHLPEYYIAEYLKPFV